MQEVAQNSTELHRSLSSADLEFAQCGKKMKGTLLGGMRFDFRRVTACVKWWCHILSVFWPGEGSDRV
jgi:hypothetical protein